MFTRFALNSIAALSMTLGFTHFAATSAFASYDELDLSSQLPPTVKLQEGGTCTLYAAAGLVEAACFRKLGRHVDFSEAALYVQDLDRLFLDPTVLDSILPESQGGGFVGSGMDGLGRGIWAINHLISGQDCYNGSEVPFDTGMITQLQNIIQAYGQEEAQRVADVMKRNPDKNAAALQRMILPIRQEERKAADDELRFEFESLIKNPGSDPDISACLRGPKMSVVDLSAPASDMPGHRRPPNMTIDPDTLERHLRQFSVPVLCEAQIVYSMPEGNKVQGEHAFIVMGVHTDTNGKKEFLIRDSNERQSYWMPLTTCERAWAIH